MSSLARLSGLTSRAVSGAGWMFASTTLGRVVAVLGQFGIGWLLAPADFGVWALALSMSSAVMALRNGGTTQILIQRGAQYGTQARFFLRYSLAFNALSAAILVGLSIPYLLEHSAVGLALLGIAASLPLATPAMLYRAKLTIDARFRTLALIDFGCASLWQMTVFSLAYAGFGAASFALAPLVQTTFETLAARYSAGPLPPGGAHRPWGDYLGLLRQSAWVMLSGAVLSLATTGDYFAVGTLTDMTTVGIYYFAFQTVVTLNMPIYNGLNSVLPTLLVRLNEDPPRQIAALLRSLRTVIVIGLPLAIAFALAVPPVIHLLWRGRWDVAAHPTQILAACVPAWFIIHCTRALLEARGYWRLRFGLLAVNGAGGITSAAVGTLFGGVANIALTVSVFYVSFGLALLAGLPALGAPAREVAGLAAKPIVLNCGALGVTLAIREWLASDPGNPLWNGGAALIFILLVGLGNLLLFKPVWSDVVQGFASGLRGRASGAAAVGSP